MFRSHMSLPIILHLLALVLLPRQLLPQALPRVLPRYPRRLPPPGVKAGRRVLRLPLGSKMAMEWWWLLFQQSQSHRGFDVENAKRSYPLRHCSSKLQLHTNKPIAVTNSSYSRHINTHNLPYKCDFGNCIVGKATQRDLDRHQDTHAKIRRYFCPVTGCPWAVHGDRGGFSRRLDNAKRHMELSHGNDQNMSVLREDLQGRLSRV